MASEPKGLSQKATESPIILIVCQSFFGPFPETYKKVTVDFFPPPIGKTRPFIGTRQQFTDLIHVTPKVYGRDSARADCLTQPYTGVWGPLVDL